LVFVFDGEPPELKREELRKRRENREKALEEWRKALRAGDYAKGFSKAVMTSRLTKPMIEDAKRLLLFLGIPFVQAPSEGEAQASYMAKRGDVWAASSKDYDGVLFGAPRLLRFLTIHGKEYLPSKGTTRPLKPEMIVLHEFLSSHRITHQQLVDIAILVGTDFNQGVKGTGPKTALKLIKEHKRIENLPGDYLSKVAPEFQKVRDIYFHPKTTSHYDMEYGSLLEDDLLHFLCDQRDFARNRVETAVHRMRAFYKERQQRKLEGWFKEKTCKQTNSSLLENLRRDVNSLKKAFVV
jgi:flap endonuclease-1